jgi:hypothetical protein
MSETIDPVPRLNEFLSDEIAAEMAYRVSAERLARGSDAPYLGLLRQLQEEHELAAEAIRDQIRATGGEPADASGSLGAWGAATRCTAPLFGGARRDPSDPSGDASLSTLECLRLGEAHNLENYKARLAELDPSAVQLLVNLLIPTQRRHIHVLDELLGDQ